MYVILCWCKLHINVAIYFLWSIKHKLWLSAQLGKTGESIFALN